MEELVLDEDGAQGEAAAEGLAQDEDVGTHLAVFKGEPASGAAQSALDLVEDQQGVVEVGEAACLCEKGGGALVHTALAEQRLDEDGAGVVVDGCGER